MEGDFYKSFPKHKQNSLLMPETEEIGGKKKARFAPQYGDRSGISNQHAFLLSADYPTEFRLMGEELHLSQGL